MSGWSLHEDTALHRLWRTASLAELDAALPARSMAARRWRAAKLGLRRMRVGSPTDKRIDPLFVRLKAIRMGRSITQRALAVRIGIDQTTLSDWERGKSGPDWVHLRAWLDSLEIELVARERLRQAMSNYADGGIIKPPTKEQLMGRRAA